MTTTTEFVRRRTMLNSYDQHVRLREQVANLMHRRCRIVIANIELRLIFLPITNNLPRRFPVARIQQQQPRVGTCAEGNADALDRRVAEGNAHLSV